MNDNAIGIIITIFMLIILGLLSMGLGYLEGWDKGFHRGFYNGVDSAEKRISEHDLKAKIIVNGNCMMCGKPLTGNNLFICEECQKKNEVKKNDKDN
jgi:hypothetical protein